MSNEELEKLAEDATKYPYPQPKAINAEFFDVTLRARKGKVLFNEDTTFSYVTNEDINYSLKEPVFIEKLFIETDSKLEGVEVQFLLPSGKMLTFLIKGNSSLHGMLVNRIVVSIQFVLPKAFLKKQKLTFKKIEVHGRTIEDIKTLEKASLEIQEVHEVLKKEAGEIIKINKDLLAKIQAEQQELDSKHTSLGKEVEFLQKMVDELTEDKETKTEEILAIEAHLSELREKATLKETVCDELAKKELLLQSAIQQKDSALTELNTKVGKEEQKLKNLEKDTTLIAYDVQGFVKSAKSNIKVYIGLSALPWLLICVISIILFVNTDNMAGISLIEKDKVDLTTVFWSRIPFAIIISSILFISYEVSISFAKKILDLHQRILDLQKIGIIAKDVSEASLTNLDGFTDEEKYELRTKLKMDLLRSHLAKDFDKPEPFKISNPSLLSRFKLAREILFGKKEMELIKNAQEESKSNTDAPEKS